MTDHMRQTHNLSAFRGEKEEVGLDNKAPMAVPTNFKISVRALML